MASRARHRDQRPAHGPDAQQRAGGPVDELRDLPEGVTEWFLHPGYPDPASGSEYDMARREDLDTLLRHRVRERFDKPIWDGRRADGARRGVRTGGR